MLSGPVKAAMEGDRKVAADYVEDRPTFGNEYFMIQRRLESDCHTHLLRRHHPLGFFQQTAPSRIS